MKKAAHPGRRLAITFALTMAGMGALLAVLWSRRPRLTEQQVASAVTIAIQRESPRSFLVTGALDLTGSAELARSLVLLPGLLDLGVSRTSVTVQVPARVSYGVEAQRITPRAIRLVNDSTVRVQLPPVRIYSVEPNLAQLRVHTDKGWMPVGRQRDAEELRQRGLAQIQTAVRRQAESHLATSSQPRVNTARALEQLLKPVLVSLGIQRPHIVFDLGSGFTIER